MSLGGSYWRVSQEMRRERDAYIAELDAHISALEEWAEKAEAELEQARKNWNLCETRFTELDNGLEPWDADECRCASGHHTCGKPNPEEEIVLLRAELEQARTERDDANANASYNALRYTKEQRYRDALERIGVGLKPDGYGGSREWMRDVARDALAGEGQA